MSGFKKNEGPAGKKKATYNAVGWMTLESVLGVLGLLFLVLGALIGCHWEEFIDGKFQEEMVLRPTSQGVEQWIEPPVEIITRIYFWNWTNPHEIGTEGYKPVFNEVGPYVFKEKHKKVNLTWNEDGTVSYRQIKKYFFDRDLSVGDLTDNITSLNIIATALADRSAEWGFFNKRLVSMSLVAGKHQISWTKTVGQLTFEGFDNTFQKFGSFIFSKIKDKFGFFYGMNGTVQPEVYTMSTGSDNIFSIGDVRSFNGAKTTDAHSGSCSKFRGSFGELWPPHRTSESVLTMFTPDMCRPISYYYIRESSMNGLSTLLFGSTPLTVDNGTLLEENKCFCPPDGCLPSGLYDVRSCQNAPVLMSLPHFHLADPVYGEAVVGMNPDPEKHKFLMEIEPRTAVPVMVAARLQLNVLLKRHDHITMFKNVDDALMPIWWMETVMSLPATHTSDIKLLSAIIFCGPYMAAIFIVIGGIFLIAILARRYHLLYQRKKKLRNEKSIIAQEKSDVTLITHVDRRHENEELAMGKLQGEIPNLTAEKVTSPDSPVSSIDSGVVAGTSPPRKDFNQSSASHASGEIPQRKNSTAAND